MQHLLNYNSFLPGTQNNSLNSTVIQQENLDKSENFTQQDTQIASQVKNEQIIETTATTTQQSISPIHPNLTTLRPKNPTLPQVTLQSTVKPSVAPKNSHMDYQTYRPMTKPSKTRKTFTRSNFAEHNYNYVNPSQTTQPPAEIHKIFFIFTKMESSKYITKTSKLSRSSISPTSS